MNGYGLLLRYRDTCGTLEGYVDPLGHMNLKGTWTHFGHEGIYRAKSYLKKASSMF